MALQPSIILSGQPLNAIGALSAGQQAGQLQRQTGERNALDAFLRQNGSAVMGGDQKATNALANYGAAGLDAAMGVQTNRLNMDNTRQGMEARAQQMGMLDAQEARAIEQHAASLSAAQRAEEAARIEEGVRMGLMVQTPEEWDQMAAATAPELVGQFDNREALAGRYMSVAEILKRNDAMSAPVETSYIVSGQGAADLGLDPNASYNITSGPGGMKATKVGGGDTNVTVENNTGGSSELFTTLDKKQGEMFSTLIDEGMNVPAKLAQIDQLEAYLGGENTPEGIEAALKAFAGDLGIPTEGLDQIQAARAIINQLVPQQRPAGSGTMSDADLALFKSSLPRLINTRGGNQLILTTMRGIAQYQQAQADIANALANREISDADARKALRELENPLQRFRGSGETTIGGGIDPETQSLIDRYAD